MSESFKGLIAIIAIIAIIITAFVGFSSFCSRIKYDEKLEGTSRQISFTYVNIREKPFGKIIDQIPKFTNVTLTGRYREYLWSEEDTLWYEVKAGELQGWITFEAVKEIPIWEY